MVAIREAVAAAPLHFPVQRVQRLVPGGLLALAALIPALACSSTSAPALAITSIAPTVGPAAGGTVVTVTGDGFAAGATVSFGGAAGTSVTVASATSATVTTPAHAAGAVDVVVALSGKSVTLAGAFTYQAPVFAAPTVSAVSPASAALAGNVQVALTGTGFRGGATVAFGGAAATGVTVVSATSITCTAPAHAAGVVDVVVTNSDAKAGTLSGGFEYIAAPTLTAVAPALGPAAGGTTVTLTGTGFRSGLTVQFGGAAATGITVASATSATCTAPAHAAGPVDVVVANADAQSATLAQSFSYYGATTITGVFPGSGPLAGGTTVTIQGTGFSPASTAAFGSAAVTATFVDSNHLTVTSPAGAAGRVAVSTNNPGSTAASEAAAFNYVPAASEVIVAVNSTIAAQMGGLLVFDPAADSTVPPNGESIFAQSNDLTGLVAPSRLFVKPGAQLYVVNSYPANDGALLRFAWQPGDVSPGIGAWAYGHRTGNTPPQVRIQNPASPASPILQQPTALAWDSTADQIIVGSYLTGELVWIDPAATSGVVAPVRTLQTIGGGIGGVVYDDRTSELYVVNGNTGTIDVWDEPASGTTAAKRSIAIAGYNAATDYAVDLFLQGDELFVLLTSSLQTSPRLASGTTAPLRKIAGANVGFTRGSGLGYDLAAHELYVADRGNGTAGIYVFNRSDTGNVAPKRVIAGTVSDIGDPIGVFVNHDPHDCAANTVFGADVVPLWFDAACGKSLGVNSLGVVSTWRDRNSGLVLATNGGTATYAFDSALSDLMVVQTDGAVEFSRVRGAGHDGRPV